MTSKKLLSCILVASLLTGTIPVGMSAVADETPSVVTITPGTDEAKTGTGQLTITLKIKQSITPTVSIADWQYKGTPSTPEVTGNTGNGEVTYLYKAKDADDSTYSETVPTAVGQYTVKASIAETADYKAGEATADFEIKPYTTGLTITLKIKQSITPTVSLTGWTYGGTANTPEVTGNSGSGDVTYLYKAKDADDSTYSDTVPTAAGEYTVKAVIAETDEYKAGEATADFTIAKATPTPEAPTNLTAEYGKTLAYVELPTAENGTWAWDAPETSVGNVGNNTFAATFTPTDTANYNNYSANLTVAVTAISATPTAVGTLNATYGQTLADVKLPTVEDGSGTWAWKDAATTPVGNAGEHTFTAKFTPTNTNYTPVEQEVTVNVAKAVPTLTDTSGLSATYGATLADVKLPTGWTWDAPDTSVGNVGEQSFAATFTPADTDNYNVVKQNLTVKVVAVNKAALNEAVTAADKYLATIRKTVYADPAMELSFAITDAKAVAENDNVTEEQVAQAITAVNNAVTTAKAAVKEIDDTLAAKAVTDMINALPAAEDIKSADKEAVDAARAAYTKLTEAQKAKVEKASTDKLAAAEKAVADHIAADAVIEKINAIGTVALTDESKALIDAARAAYGALMTEAQKSLVSNYPALTAAEQEYLYLLVSDVEAKINAIGNIELTDAVKAKIGTARTAYDALTADQQKLVKNAVALGYAENLYTALEGKSAAEAEAEAQKKAAEEALKAKKEAEEALANAKKEADKKVAAAQTAQKAAEKAQATAEKTAEEAAEKAAAAEAAQKEAEKALAKGEKDAAAKVAAAQTAQKTAEAAQKTAEKAATEAKAAQTKAEKEAAAAKTAQANAQKAQAAAETAKKEAEEALAKAQSDAAAKIAAAEAAQAKAEESAKEAAKKAAAAETAQKEAEEALAKGEKDAAAKVAAAETAKKAAEKAQAIAEQTAKDAEAKAAAALAAQKAAEEALAKAQSDAAAKIAAAEAAQAKAEKSSKEAAEKAAAAETARKEAEEALAKGEKDAAAKVAAAETAKTEAEEAAKTAEADKSAAELSAKEAAEAQSAAEALAKQAESEKAAAEKKAAEEKTAADKAAAEKVIEKINAIGKVDKSNTSENKIIAARSAYDTLTDEQKDLVTNYDVLTKAESAYDTLPKTGMSGLHKVFAGLAALMGITGVGLVKKSRKEDEE